MKRILGSLIAISAVALMAVGVQAATYSAGSVSASDGNDATVPVIVTPDDSSTESVNGYIITFTYDGTKASPVVSATADAAGEDCYATVGDTFADGVLVSDVISGADTSEETLAVAWASAEAVSVDEAAYLATVDFEILDTTASTIPVTVTVVQLTNDGSALTDTYEAASGTINLADATFLRGDANDDGTVDISDANTITQYLVGLVTVDDIDLDQANANADTEGTVDISDANTITQYLVGLVDIPD